MRDRQQEIIERYYKGETTLEEERRLKAAFRKGEYSDEPVLSFQEKETAVPEDLMERIRTGIHRKARYRMRQRILAISSVAALLILILSLPHLLSPPETLQLSDNLKKERFEDALRVIGNVIEEKTPPVQRVLYEDNRLIIAVE